MSDPTEPDQRPTPESDPTRNAWDDVGNHLGNLGKHVRERFEQSTGAARAGSGQGGDSVRRWIDTLDDAFTSLGDAVRDPAFRREAESSVERLADALGGTLSELGEQLQRRFGRSAPPPGDSGVSDTPTGGSDTSDTPTGGSDTSDTGTGGSDTSGPTAGSNGAGRPPRSSGADEP